MNHKQIVLECAKAHIEIMHDHFEGDGRKVFEHTMQHYDVTFEECRSLAYELEAEGAFEIEEEAV